MISPTHTCWFLVCGPLDDAQAERFKELALVAEYQWTLCGYEVMTDCLDYGVDPQQLAGEWVTLEPSGEGGEPLPCFKSGDRVVSFCAPDDETHWKRLDLILSGCQAMGMPLETIWL